MKQPAERWFRDEAITRLQTQWPATWPQIDWTHPEAQVANAVLDILCNFSRDCFQLGVSSQLPNSDKPGEST